MADPTTLTAVVLAGGLGTRLTPVIKDAPKVLAPIGGKPFLAYILNQLANFGAREVVLCTGYLGEQIEARFGRGDSRMRLLYSRDPAPRGTAGALRSALSVIESDTVLVLNGDSYCAANLDEFSRWHYEKHAAATLLLVNQPDTGRFGRVQVSFDKRIESFEEKQESAEAGAVNAGVYLITRDWLRRIPDRIPLSLEREIFPSWIGGEFYGYQVDRPFLDIGTPESYAVAEAFFATI